ncbi:hypothetical protein BJX76DRAFT_347341 [Aspergillus varians]
MRINLAAYLASTVLLLSQSSAGYVNTDAAVEKCATNATYTVVSGDTCARIARAHSITRGALILLNDIRSGCADLRVGQVLCLPRSCEVYPIQLGDTCVAIAEANNIGVSDILNWNTFLDPECTNLVAGDQVCVAEPRPNPNPIITIVTPSLIARGYATATVAPPGPVPRGTTARCGQYYQVKSGDYCDSIADRFSLDFGLFREINPAINAECTNLVPGLYYCVSPTVDWNQTTTTTVTSAYTSAPAPTPSGTTSHCYEWYVVRSGDTCYSIASLYGTTVQDISLWNPSLRADCSNLRAGLAYCIHGDSESTMAWLFAVATASSTAADGEVMAEMLQ